MDKSVIAAREAAKDAQRCTERLGMEPAEHRALLEDAWYGGLLEGYIRPVTR